MCYFAGSVFDLVSSKDKDKMERARKGTELSVVQSSDKNLISIPEGQQSFKAPSVISSTELQLVPVHTVITEESQQAQPGIDQPRTSAPAFQGGSLSFKPFIKDERKQARYEKYLVLVKQGMKGNIMCYQLTNVNAICYSHTKENDIQ